MMKICQTLHMALRKDWRNKAETMATVKIGGFNKFKEPKFTATKRQFLLQIAEQNRIDKKFG